VRTTLLGVILVTTLAASAGAQILDLPHGRGEPTLWGSASVGFFQLGTVTDGRTGSRWDFGNAARYRASLQYPLSRSAALGFAGTWSRMPLRYSLSGEGGTQSVDAHAIVSSLMLEFYGGGGSGLHQVLSASAGVTRFSDFTADARGEALAPTGGDVDFAFTLAYGFGYSLSARAQIVLLQEYGVSVHQRDRLPNDASTAVRQNTTSLGLRYGFGGRAR
jgi:hypothetical protein